jgi:branched-chain amino acid transport system ATP-binding protein
MGNHPDLLRVSSLSTGYMKYPVIHGIDLDVGSGELVGLMGANGAGKTTTLLAIAGELPVLGGQIHIEGVPPHAPLYRRARAGVSLVTEGRSVFSKLNVIDNLRVGGCDAQVVFELFPELAPLRHRQAGLLSGGEQQMLSLGRALARKPRLLLVDELSLGLAPLIVDRLLIAIREAADRMNIGVLLVEQHANLLFEVVDRVYVMRQGTIALQGDARDVAGRLDEVTASYLSDQNGAASGPKAVLEPFGSGAGEPL